MTLEEMHSLYASLGFEQQFTDLLAVLRDAPRETTTQGDVDDIRVQDVIPVKSFSFSPEQKSVYQERLAGEGAENSTLAVGELKLRASATMPVIAPTVGWVDPVIGVLWDAAKLAIWGTASAARSKVAGSGTLSAGATTIEITNVGDFSGLILPVTASIVPTPESGENGESIVITAVNKSTRTITLQSATSFHHNKANIQVVTLPYRAGPVREPAFSLMSLREGMLSPCLVNKLTFTAKAGSPVELQAEFATLNLIRSKQVALRSAREELLTAAAKLGTGRIINGTDVSISNLAAAEGAFGLPTAVGDTIFGGYQGLEIHPITVTSLSLTVDNHLVEIHSSHSLETGTARFRENRMPFALASEGRTISGKITYKSSLEPWAVAERLSGSSSLANGGLIVDFSSFNFEMPEIAWKISSSTGDVNSEEERTLEWTMVAENYDAMPLMGYSEQV